MGRKWRAWKGSLKDLAYDPSLTVDEIVSQQVKNDNRLNQDQFKELVTRWFTPEFQIKDFILYIKDLDKLIMFRLIELGYLGIGCSRCGIANDSTITPADPNDFTIDEYSKVKGPEKRRYVRLVGRILAEKSDDASSTDSQTIDQLKSVVNAMAVIIQENIPNANLSSVLGNMNIQVPGVGSLANNTSSVNEMSSSRIPNDNGYGLKA
ncbi:uncharacterized protein LOC143617966 [Bidens hawaiensis]|uniref:uncharacterized protein LOC143617966 n=1 Tax=Bidens hawaiensis TaxID=980011 RepID=UPI00404B2726